MCHLPVIHVFSDECMANFNKLQRDEINENWNLKSIVRVQIYSVQIVVGTYIVVDSGRHRRHALP